MRWGVALGWLVACVLIGVGIYRRYYGQARDYRQWVAFCDHLGSAIGFSLQPLPQAVADYLPVCRGGCHAVLTGYLQCLRAQVDLTRAKCQSLAGDAVIAEFLYQLGRTGRETEQARIQAVRAIFTGKAEQAERDLRGKASILLKLLIIIGMVGGILWM